MEIFSNEFMLIFLMAVVILIIVTRRKGGATVLTGKQISIMGQRLTTFLSINTPLICLLENGKYFGHDFQNKKAPELPHQENCQCQLTQIIHRSQDLFSPKQKENGNHDSDLGVLAPENARFYDYFLIAHHQEASRELKEEYQDLADNVSLSQEFQKMVKNHLQSK